ncbi:MAG: Ubiquinone biosynthesis O-methyltransferase [Pseudomonas citronellolis]|nr:MAG: Ubiquinone biosynthesis O-methyltransferase [Pseudomonas citronellolis]
MDDAAQRIRDSWQHNAEAWTRIIREQRIDSRRLVTDAAMLQAVRTSGARRVLDIGCGEGWLCRALSAEGLECLGVDACAELIEAARAMGDWRFEVFDYGQLLDAAAVERLGRFDALLCNFALLDEHLQPWLRGLHAYLRPDGQLIIQTLHPWSVAGEQGYVDGWRVETFEAFAGEFRAPMPWYFRTLASWLALLQAAGWRLVELREPRHADNGQVCSLLLSAVPA